MAVRISSLRKFVSVQAPPPRCIVRRDDESGLTTLEWLLIVAAVAGLAALAVVLVQNVVDSTAEQISNSSARLTSAIIAGNKITDDAMRPAASQPSGANTWEKWERYYTDRCNRLGVIYANANVKATSNYDFITVSSPSQHSTGGAVNPGLLTKKDSSESALFSPSSAKGVAQCRIAQE